MHEKVLIFLSKSVATTFGLGYFKHGSGTLVSLVTIIVIWLFNFNEIVMFFIIVISFIMGMVSISYLENKTHLEHDSSILTIDELFGMCLTLFPLYLFNQDFDFWWFFIAFCLFRLFDIIKPFGIRKLDEVIQKGFGVMIDDGVAALYACVCLILIISFVKQI